MTSVNSYSSAKEKRDAFVAALDATSYDFWLATWFKTGLIIPAPGTWGTLGGLLFGVPLLYLFGSPFVFLAGAVLFFMGLKAVERIEEKLGDHDPSFIVIDEVAAILMMIALLPNFFLPITLIVGFLLFRYFDACKPWLVGVVDKKIQGALGVMLDDVVAAFFALVTYYILMLVGFLVMSSIGWAIFDHAVTVTP